MNGQSQLAAGEIVVKAALRLLEKKQPLLIAIDGRSGSGKSTLAEAASRELGAAIVAADDFYPGDSGDWAELTVEKRVDRVFDWHRLRRDAVEPLLRGDAVRWLPLDFDPALGWVGWKQEQRRFSQPPL